MYIAKKLKELNMNKPGTINLDEDKNSENFEN